MSLKYIIWDVDGTLYQSNKELHNFFEKAYKKILLSYLKKHPHIDKELIIELFKQRKKLHKSSTLALSSLGLGSPEKITRFFENKKEKEKAIKPSYNLVKIFSKLKNYTHFALRNGTTQETKKILKILGIEKIRWKETGFGPFRKVFGTITLAGTTKPDPLVFEAILTYIFLHYEKNKAFKTDLSKALKDLASKTLIIGDRKEVDLKPAKKFGMKTCWVTQEKRKPSYVDIVIENLEELPKKLLNL